MSLSGQYEKVQLKMFLDDKTVNVSKFNLYFFMLPLPGDCFEQK